MSLVRMIFLNDLGHDGEQKTRGIAGRPLTTPSILALVESDTGYVLGLRLKVANDA
jgi:hypothetical protein